MDFDDYKSIKLIELDEGETMGLCSVCGEPFSKDIVTNLYNMCNDCLDEFQYEEDI